MSELIQGNDNQGGKSWTSTQIIVPSEVMHTFISTSCNKQPKCLDLWVSNSVKYG